MASVVIQTLKHLAYLQLDCDQLLHHSCISAIELGSARETAIAVRSWTSLVETAAAIHCPALAYLAWGKGLETCDGKKKYRPSMPTQVC